MIVTEHRTRINQKVVSVEGLDREMILRRATNDSLSEVAGVSPHTVSKLRNGKTCHPFIAACILQALTDGRKFTRSNQGAKNRL